MAVPGDSTPRTPRGLRDATEEPGFPSLSRPSWSSPLTKFPSMPFSLPAFLKKGNADGVSFATGPKPALKPIKTPHDYSPSHPELAFSPTDIGIWEVHKEKRNTFAPSPNASAGQPASTQRGWSLFSRS